MQPCTRIPSTSAVATPMSAAMHAADSASSFFPASPTSERGSFPPWRLRYFLPTPSLSLSPSLHVPLSLRALPRSLLRRQRTNRKGVRVDGRGLWGGRPGFWLDTEQRVQECMPGSALVAVIRPHLPPSPSSLKASMAGSTGVSITAQEGEALHVDCPAEQARARAHRQQTPVVPEPAGGAMTPPKP